MLNLHDPLSARQWLQQFKSDSVQMFAIRKVVLEELGGADISRLSDDSIINHMAHLIASRRVHIHDLNLSAHPQRQDASVRAAAAKSAAFPLAERASPRKSSSSSEPEADSSTFPPSLDSSAQTAALTAASSSGKPFCPQ